MGYDYVEPRWGAHKKWSEPRIVKDIYDCNGESIEVIGNMVDNPEIMDEVNGDD